MRLKRVIWRLRDWKNGQRQHTDVAATQGSESGLTLAVFPIVAVSVHHQIFERASKSRADIPACSPSTWDVEIGTRMAQIGTD